MAWSAARGPGRRSSACCSRSLRATRAPGSTRPTIGNPRTRRARRLATDLEGSRRACIVTGVAMPWLADSDVGAAYGFARSIVGSRTEAELRHHALEALAELVPADVLTWDRVELATGAIDHEATPVGAEPAGAFDAVVGRARDHPLLAAHADRRRPALQLSELVEPHALARGGLYGARRQGSGWEYEMAIG